MTYRDEKEALRSRVAALEARNAELEADLAKALQPPAAERSGARASKVLVAVLVLGALGGALFLLFGKDAGDAAKGASASAAPPPKVVARARWTADVASAAGVYIPPDARCTVDATMQRMLGEGGKEVLGAGFKVVCGKLVVYNHDAGDRPDQTQYDRPFYTASCTGKEQAAPEGRHRHALKCKDDGSPGGRMGPSRPALEMDSEVGTFTLTSLSPPMNVELRVQPWSAERDGPALY